MSIVADTHAIIWYVIAPEKLSETALKAIEQAEQTTGIVVSVASLAEMWYLVRKTSSPALSRRDLRLVKELLLDKASNAVVSPIRANTITRFDQIPSDIRDPFDRFIVATAGELGLPLVTADQLITSLRLVSTIW